MVSRGGGGPPGRARRATATARKRIPFGRPPGDGAPSGTNAITWPRRRAETSARIRARSATEMDLVSAERRLVGSASS